MGCKRAWEREFLDGVLPKSFMTGEYKRHRETVLYDREMALLPATQDAVAGYREAKTLEARIKDMRAEGAAMSRVLRERKLEYWNLAERLRRMDRSASGYRAMHETVRVARRAATEMQRERRDKQIVLGTARYRLGRLRQYQYVLPADDPGADALPDPPANRRSFIRACPAEGCRGFLSTQWKCGTCDVRVCAKCHEIKTPAADGATPAADGATPAADGHVCNPDSVASAALIAKDSKPCPGCASLIHRVSGCSQMFCVQCKVAFDWHSGQVVTNTNAIHNPHYYEWLRRTRGHVPRAAGDDPCANQDRLPDYWQMRRVIGNSSTLYKYHRLALHVNASELPTLRQAVPPDDRDLRLKYLVQEVDARTWRVKLQRREKLREKVRAVGQVYEMFYAASVDIFGAMTRQQKDSGTAKVELAALVQYADTCLRDVSQRLGMKVRALSSHLV